jgi:hypothetical protein
MFLPLALLPLHVRRQETSKHRGKAKMPASVTLSVNVSSHRVFVYLVFANHSADQDFYLEKSKLPEAPLRSDLFRIESEGKPVAYLGPMAKRRAPGPEDFVKLAPREELKKGADITDIYGFLPGSHDYTIQYCAFHSDPDDASRIVELKSERVSFTFAK